MADYADPLNTATRLQAQRATIERQRARIGRLVSELTHCQQMCNLQRIELANKDRWIAELKAQTAND